MKKILFTISASIAVLTALGSCQKNEANPGSDNQTITAYVNAGLKLQFSDNQTTGGSGLSSVWETGDTFYAIQDGEKTIQFTLVSGAGTTSGVFQATTSGVTESTAWVGILGNSASVSGTSVTCAYMTQTGKIGDIDDCYYVAATATGLEPSFDFASGTKMSYVLRVKLPAGVKTVEFTPSAYFTVGSDGAPVEVTHNSYSGTESSEFGADKTGIITLDSVSAAGDVVYINVPAIDYSRERYNRDNKQNGNWVTAVIITLLNGTETDATASNGTIVENNLTAKAGKVATLDMSGLGLMKRPTPAEAVLLTNSAATCSISTNFKQAASVSTYWAPFNVGAASETETGNYYSFGEIMNKSDHSFVSYTLRHKPSGTNYDDYFAIKGSKLVDDDKNSTFYTVTGSRYDVARVLWGTSWRLPHLVECAALTASMSKTSAGITFTGENSNSIFIPVTGFYKNTGSGEKHNDLTYVEIWSADKNNRTQGNAGWNQACALYVNAEGTDFACDRFDQYAGLAVRPVLVSSSFAPAEDNETNATGNAPTFGEDK